MNRSTAGLPALLLLASLFSLAANASDCLRQLAPEVAPWLLTGDQAELSDAVAKLDDQIARQSTADQAAPWLAAQASMLIDMGELDAAIDRLEQAVAGWALVDAVAVEVCARHLLAFAQSLAHRPRAAMAEALLAEARAKAVGLEGPLNQLRQTRVALMLSSNERLEEGLLLMMQTSPGETPAEQIRWHHSYGLLLGRLRRHRKAAWHFEQALELAEQNHHQAAAASARFNLVNQLSELPLSRQDASERERIHRLLESVIEDEHAHGATRALAYRLLATHRPDDQTLLPACVELAAAIGDRRRQAACLADLAMVALERRPAEAEQFMQQAVSLVEGDLRAGWQIQPMRIRLLWASHPPLAAFNESLQVLAGEQQLREHQMSGPERAWFIDSLVLDYLLLADLAYAHANRYPELAGRALELLEANRALVLREQRRLIRAEADNAQLEVLIAEINRQRMALIKAGDDPKQVQAIQAKLRDAELQWQSAVTAEPEQAEPLPAPLSLAELRLALGDAQALLSFLTTTPRGMHDGNGWLHVLTRHEEALYRVPDAAQLQTAARLLDGLPDWELGPARRLLDQLGHGLLHEVLRDLPEQIRHLVIIPDAGVQSLPLALLPGPDGHSLGLQYALEFAPSASLWHSLRERRPLPGNAMVLADPRLPEAGYRVLDQAFPDGAPARLPGAVEEARRIRRLLGRWRTRIFTGQAASETRLAGGLSDQTRLIHFATHALAHPTRPGESAVLLAAGGSHDGLLQTREIEQLRLDDTVVVLSTCVSAIGDVLDSEGVMSLARSFLIAGAIAVVATRRELEDAHAKAYATRLYRHMADGARLAEAMRLTKLDLQQAGYPAQAWSAYVLYGHGDWQPVRGKPRWPGWLLLVAGLLASAISLVLLRRSRLGYQEAP